MADHSSYPVAQAMQRHTGCQFVKPKLAPPTVPEQAPPAEEAAPSLVPAKIENQSER